MLTGTIVKLPDGTYKVRISKRGPKTEARDKIIEILYQKDGESGDDFRDRCLRFVQEECP